MKKIIVAALLMISAESTRVTPEQVPAAVLQAYEKEIGSLPEGGTWTVRIKRSTDKRTTTPVWYKYTNRNAEEKIEVRFSPSGEIEEAKGVTLLNGVSRSKKTETEKN
jgi:hypothetical protein